MDQSPAVISYAAAFLGGLAVSFTPCVYPLIPITLSVIGANSVGSRVKGLLLSIVYISGLALVYAALGVIAAMSGSFFGAISVHPITRIIVGIVIFLFGLSLLDVLPFNILSVRKNVDIKSGGIWKVFILGITSGFAVSPCVSPALFSILTYVASERNVIYGATLLLAFAYGMGFILVLSGTFSALLVNLPKAGPWMERIKKLYGLILLAVALYFMSLGIKELI